jgi:CheY-like chemotaxis protein
MLAPRGRPQEWNQRFVNREKSDRKQINVLIVDDDPDLLEVTRFVLESEGFTVETATHGEAALARLRAPGKLPALVLLDMMMPEVDGADFLKRLARLSDRRTVPVIIVSAIGHLLQGLRRSDVDAAGVAEVLPKPVSYTTLVETIGRVIGPP